MLVTEAPVFSRIDISIEVRQLPTVERMIPTTTPHRNIYPGGSLLGSFFKVKYLV